MGHVAFEIGHTYQMERMDWHDMVEVTVNIYSLRAQKRLGNVVD